MAHGQRSSRSDLAVLGVGLQRSRVEISLLDAAAELLISAPDRECTVDEVVVRSGQSLRSLYECFGGKHELLVALLEDIVGSAAEHLRARVAVHDDADARLHCFVVEYAGLCRPRPNARSTGAQLTPALMDFAGRLLTDRPEEAARAFLPITSLVRELLEDGVAEGAVRRDLRSDPAGVLMQAIMFSSFSLTIANVGESESWRDDAELLWEVLRNGVVGIAQPI